jgi:uncharacterized membrane protein
MRTLRSVAILALVAHAILIIASVIAFWLIIDRPPPAWADPAMWARSYAIGMAWTGPIYIVTGFLAAAAGWLAVAGWRRGALGIAVVLALSLGVEMLGVATGVPFGGYAYGTTLGPLVLGLVPVVIPLSWFMMLYASVAIAVRFHRGVWGTAVIASLGLVAWDVLMDPAMSMAFPFWSWHTDGVYYGMPLVNWFGWFLTGIVIAVPLLLLAGYASRSADPRGPRDRVPAGLAGALERDWLPLAIYALNGFFPLVLALSRGMIGAAVIGSVVMAAFYFSPALARTRRVPATIPAPVRQA